MKSIHPDKLKNDIRLEWNAASGSDWPKIEHLFINAYISAYKDCDPKEFASDDEEDNDDKISFNDLLYRHFKKDFDAEKEKISNQNNRDRYRSHYLIARFHDQPIAFFVCQLNYKSGRIYLRWITMHPKFHKHGIGSAMLKEIANRFPKSKGLELYTRKINESAQLFYTKCGFSPISEFDFEEPLLDSEKQPGYFSRFVEGWLNNEKLFPPLDEKTSQPENFIGFAKEHRKRTLKR